MNVNQLDKAVAKIFHRGRIYLLERKLAYLIRSLHKGPVPCHWINIQVISFAFGATSRANIRLIYPVRFILLFLDHCLHLQYYSVIH